MSNLTFLGPDVPKADPRSENCVRWNPKRKVYELVVNGAVRASASKLKMSLRGERLKFFALVQAAALESKRRG